MKTIKCLAWLLLVAQCLVAQRPTDLTVTTFTNFNYPDVEPAYAYDFVPPVEAYILEEDSASYKPDIDHRYFMSIYGPRHKEVSSSNIGFFDFHKGSDITPDVTNADGTFDEANPPNIQCRCDGEVYETFDDENLNPNEEIEDTGTGRFVIIKCDSTFKANPAWGNIYMAYRHLDSINADLKDYINGTVRVSKGDFIGTMGATGHTSTIHLHYSVIRRNTGSQINVHPMRVFDPAAHPHLLYHLDEAEMVQLDYTDTSAFFRVIIPYNRANIRALEIDLVGGNYQRVYDFETISLLPDENRDDNDVVDGLELFAYPFNRGDDAYTRLWRRFDDQQITSVYPANPTHDHFAPFLSEGLLSTPAYAMDIKVSDLPQGYNINNLQIKVIDIYGYGVSAFGTSSHNHFAWSMISQDSDDAEEFGADANENPGAVQLSDIDLELVRDYNKHGNQTVGLRFADLGIPSGAVVTKAWIQFRADYTADPTNDQATNLKIKAENTANALTFQNALNNLTNRDTTEMAIDWQILVPWNPSEMGPDQKIEVTELVQEVISRNNNSWDENSPLSFLISGTGKRKAESFDDDTEKNPYLYIEYTINSLSSLGYAPEVFLSNPEEGTEYMTLAPISLAAIAFDPDHGLSKVEFWVDNVKIGEDTTLPFGLDWAPAGFGSYQIKATAIDTEGNTSDSAVHTISFTDPNQNFNFWKRIDDDNFDVEEHQDGTIWKNNSDLEMCWDSYVPSGATLPIRQQHVGLRFPDIDIPKHATITNAYIQFTADESHSNQTTISIWGEQNGNTTAFSYDDFDVSTRTATNASVNWVPASWTQGDSTTAQRTPDISSIIQEIIGLPDWYQGDSLVLIFHSNDTGRRTAVSHDQEPSEAPILYIDYTLDGNALSTPVLPHMPSDYDFMPPQIEIDLKVSPNPVKGGMARVEVFTPVQEEMARISIINNNGQRVKFRQILLMDTKSTTFNLSQCPPGTYFAVVELRDDVVSEKFVLVAE